MVSDAGTPGISDPGEVIAKRAIEENIEVIPIPGACAAINALIASGLNTKEFVFFGFLPLNKKIRKEKYREFKKLGSNSTINPYTTENIAALLDYNHTHYKRFESENDSTKKMPLKKIVLLSIILETSIEDLMK